jgi:hypothetical protein
MSWSKFVIQYPANMSSSKANPPCQLGIYFICGNLKNQFGLNLDINRLQDIKHAVLVELVGDLID